jgi:hypothetical protein
MTTIIFFFALFALAIGVLVLRAPDWFAGLIRRVPRSRALAYFAMAFRVFFGVVLILASPSTRDPLLVAAFGGILVLAAVAVVFFGPARFVGFADWFANRPSLMRVAAFVGFALSAFLIYEIV